MCQEKTHFHIKDLRTLELSGGRRALDIKNLTDLEGILRRSGLSEMPMECQRMLVAQISLILKIL